MTGHPTCRAAQGVPGAGYAVCTREPVASTPVNYLVNFRVCSEQPLSLQQDGICGLWSACQANASDESLWYALVRTLIPLIRPIVRGALAHSRVAGSHDFEDLLQETCLKVCELCRSKQPVPQAEAAMIGYLRAVAANSAVDWLRRMSADKRDAAKTDSLCHEAADLIPDLGHRPRVEQDVLLAEIDSNLDCAARDRTIFWLYYRQGLTAPEIAAIPSLKLSVKGVESLIYRLTQRIRVRLAER